MLLRTFLVFGVVLLFPFFELTALADVSCFDNRFDDLASRTLLSSLVFRGRALRHQHDDSRSLQFSVRRVLKGSETATRLTLTLTDSCSNLTAETGNEYIVFATEVNSSTSGLTGRAVGLPEPASRRAQRLVSEYACDSCVGSRPRTRLKPKSSSLTVQINRKLKIQCRGQGRPSPIYMWTKDGQPIQSSRRLQIKSLRRGSRLQVKRVTITDAGVYKCQAINIVESAAKSIEVVVQPASVGRQRTTTEMPNLHSIRCEIQNLCFNGGTCFFMVGLQMQYCQCTQSFYGNRCQERSVTPLTGKVEDNTDEEESSSYVNGYDIVILVLISTIAALIILAAIIAFSCALGNWYHRRKQKGRQFQQFYQLGPDSNVERISGYRNQLASYVPVDNTPALHEHDQMETTPTPHQPSEVMNYDQNNNDDAAERLPVPDAGRAAVELGDTDTGKRAPLLRGQTASSASSPPRTANLTSPPADGQPRFFGETAAAAAGNISSESQRLIGVTVNSSSARNSVTYPTDSDPEASVV